MDATITSSTTTHSDHRALTVHIPQIGDMPFHNTAPTPPIPTTRNHPPFLLPITKPLIDLYKPGKRNYASGPPQCLPIHKKITTSNKATPALIDKAANRVVNILYAYHELAQTIWPMAQPYTQTEPFKNSHPTL